MDHFKKNPVALYAIVLLVCVIVDTLLGLVLHYSMFDFWTQFFLGFIVIGMGATVCYLTLRALEMAGVQLGLEDTPPTLITKGPYAFTRNPFYVGMTAIYVGVAILFDSPIAFIVLVPLLYYMRKVVVPAEEAMLEGKFGGAYAEYRAKVKRWI